MKENIIFILFSNSIFNNMQESQNDLNTFSIFGMNNQEEKNNENIETNMEIEENQDINENIKVEENNKDEESKKEQKEKRRVRGPNKCYRIIDQFFNDKKRAKETINNEQQNDINDEEDKKIKRRKNITNMSLIFDDFLIYVESKVNKDYYNKFITPIINNYKEFYIEKEKEFKENKSSFNIIEDENLIKKKKIYGLENFLEIPEIINDFMKFIYNQNIFTSDEDKIEMIEIIFIFCAWLKQYHYTSYNIEYLLKKEE